MSRSALHIYFWLSYVIYDTLLHFTWMGPSLSGTSDGAQLLMGVETAFSLLPVKFFLVYYIIQRGTKRVLDDKKLFPALAELGLIFFISTILFRIVNYYFTDPVIYALSNTKPLFTARSIFIAILEMGLVGGVAFALKLYRLQALAREREKNLIKEKLETELKFLRNQTNPHFLFNTLNNIYALSRRKSDKTAEVVLKLSEFLSFMLYKSGQETIPVKEEIKMMEDYIDLQKIRYNNRLTIKIDKQVDEGCQQIAPLLLLPVVENAFKHGISETRFNSSIQLNICLRDEHFSFCIENTIENGTVKNSNGKIGLTNLKRQLELMYKEHELKVDKDDHTFKVNIIINLSSYEKIHLHSSGR